MVTGILTSIILCVYKMCVKIFEKKTDRNCKELLVIYYSEKVHFPPPPYSPLFFV